MAQGLNGANTCDGETIVVNRHGALIFSSVALRVGMKIEILLVLTNKDEPPPKLSMSIPSGLGSAQSGWRNKTTFGALSFHPMTGCEDSHES